MKRMLLLLGALILSSAVWAADITEAPPAEHSSAGTEQVAQTTPPPAESFQLAAGAATCPVACRIQACPPPIGPVKKCCPVTPYTQTCP